MTASDAGVPAPQEDRHPSSPDGNRSGFQSTGSVSQTAGDRLRVRCADPAAGVYCEEVVARQIAAAEAVVAGYWEQADQLATTAARFARVHADEAELRDRR